MHYPFWFRFALSVFLLSTACGAVVAEPAAEVSSKAGVRLERRCGWFKNPTPANATLTDRDGAWEIATQGGHQAEGDWSPVFGPDQWIATNGYYGYGCACLSTKVDPDTRKVITASNPKARPLAACRADATLIKPFEEQANEPCMEFRGEH